MPSDITNFYVENDLMEEALETAKANREQDPETYAQVAAEYATWRREIRILGGRPLGEVSMWPPEVLEFAKSNPDDPRVVEARQAQIDAAQNELAALQGEAV